MTAARDMTLESRFAGAVLDPGSDAPEGVGKTGAPAKRRFDVYRNNVMVSLIEAMKAAYPSLFAMMGEDDFTKVARIFIRKSPPASPMMQDYGAGFAEFLADFEPLSGSPFVGDVARLERFWLEAYHACDAAPLNLAELGAVAQDDTPAIVFQPHPATRLLQSDHAVFDLFGARDKWPLPGVNPGLAQSVLVTRPALEIQIVSLDRDLAAFIAALLSGDNLGNAIAAAMAVSTEFDAGAAIAFILSAGAFSGIKLPDG